MNTVRSPFAPVGQPFATNAGPRLAVRFLRAWSNYFRGDVASFPSRMAGRLVDRGYAERVNIAPAGADAPEGCDWAMRPPGQIPLRQGRGDEDEVVDL
jgi:hypothetical protein